MWWEIDINTSIGRGIYQIFVYPRRLSLGSTFWWKKGLPPSLSLSSDLISASLCEGQLLPAFAPQEQPQSRPALASVPHFLLFSCAISPILNSLLPASRLNQIYPLPFGELLPGICRDSLWLGSKIFVFFVFSSAMKISHHLFGVKFEIRYFVRVESSSCASLCISAFRDDIEAHCSGKLCLALLVQRFRSSNSLMSLILCNISVH